MLATGAVLSLGILKWLPYPFLVIAAGWAILAGLLAAWAPGGWRRAAWINLAVLALLAAVLEGGATKLVATQQQKAASYHPANYARQGKVGLAPLPGTAIRSVRRLGADTVYDATYTYNAQGLRVTPAPHDSADACVLFFGDSFTLGEGVQDDESIPAQVALQSGRRITTHNFGFHGYGPQQMLASLESGHTEAALSCRPTHVVFETLFEHVPRVAGLTTWSRNHPRYVLRPDGSVEHMGFFGDVAPSSLLGERVEEQLRKSALYSLLAARQRRVTDQDWALFVGVVSQARALVAARYPEAKFEVLLFSRGRRDQDSVLRTMGFEPRIVERILPRYATDSMQYIIPDDGHPSALANRLIARYLVDSVLLPAGAP